MGEKEEKGEGKRVASQLVRKKKEKERRKSVRGKKIRLEKK